MTGIKQPSHNNIQIYLTSTNSTNELLTSFNQIALRHTRLRSALAACLRTNQANYMEWLITKHMKAAGSGAPIWAIFISWAAENLSVELDRPLHR